MNVDNKQRQTMKTYQVINYPTWYCPNMLVFVDANNNIIGQQQNPDNTLTQQWADDGNWGQFNPADYYSVKLLVG